MPRKRNPEVKSLHPAPESLFWYWIAERHAIYLRRQAGLPKPWTTDPILQTYKFCNVFRELDKGTVWLRENFLEPNREAPFELLAFNICWYRMFNWIGTGALLGWQTDWNPGVVKMLLAAAQNRGEQIFTGAHIVRSKTNPKGGPKIPKIGATVDVCTDLWKLCRAAAPQWQQVNSLEYTFNDLIQVPYVGGFMGYEMVTDMRHTRILENATDIMTWANPGNGARRGLQRLGLPYKKDAEAIMSMQTLLARSRENLPEEFPELEMRDIEHSLCEADKYCRVKFGEGEPRSKYNGS